MTSLEEELKRTKDIKQRIRLCAILAKKSGHPASIIASILRISESSVYEYLQEYEEEKKISHKVYPGRVPKLSSAEEEELITYVKNKSYGTISDLCAYVKEKYGTVYTTAGMRDWLIRNNILKKKIKKQILRTKIKIEKAI
jgi:transposase